MNILKEHNGNSIQVFYKMTYFPFHGTLHIDWPFPPTLSDATCATQTFRALKKVLQSCRLRSDKDTKTVASEADQMGANTHARGSICGVEPQQQSLWLKSVAEKTVISK